MDQADRNAGSWSAAVLALLAGPAGILADESGSIPWLPSATFWPKALVLLLAAVALGYGIRRARRSPRWVGFLIIFVNGPIVGLYGFLLVFFGLGGSR
ncbi:MAG: hypothetical protein OEM96_07605 [Gemmatimonadota bacterium]|nr:hypothetical protein [Gemmatimonadota bacterium]